MKKFSYNKLYYLDFLKEKKKKESLDKYMEDNKNKRKVSGSQKSVSEDDNRRCSLEPYDESIVNSMKDSRYPHLLVLST